MKQWIVVACLLSGAVLGSAQSGSGPTIIKPGTSKWDPFSPGVEIAVLSGDPAKAGLYTIRLRLADGTKIAPHWHPEDEHVTVLRGTFLAGMGDKFDDAALQELPAGTFVLMPKNMHHFAKASGQTVLQLHGQGPLVINYVNPEDDPAKAKK
jgi:quercetin dioxygenase-like cupin family protein